VVRWVDRASDFYRKDKLTVREDDEKRPVNPPDDTPTPEDTPPVKPQGDIDNPPKNPPPPPPGQGGG
jgi:hypothetical protein